MTFQGLDFDGDKPFFYAEVRKALAEIYEFEDIQLFGGVKTKTLTQEELESKSQEELIEIKKEIKHYNTLITKGKHRVQEKIKEIRQSFSKALINGTRSGSGKIVYAHFDELKQIWKGSANVEPLNFGVDTSSTNNTASDEKEIPASELETETTDLSSSSTSLSLSIFGYDGNDEISDDDHTTDLEVSNIERQKKKKQGICNSTCSKRTSSVTKLVDNRRKHLEKNLSAAQRDKLFLDEAKADALFRKDIARAMEESNKTFAEKFGKITCYAFSCYLSFICIA